MSACQRRRGFSLVEALIVVGIIGALLALLLPAIQASRESARNVQCKNNLHQLGVAYHLLASRQGAGVPVVRSASRWVSTLSPFMEQSAPMLWCPNDQSEKKVSSGDGQATANGVIVLDKPPASLQLGRSENSCAVLYVESRDLALPSSISVDISKPGYVSNSGGLSKSTIPAGTLVDVYLLHYDPVGPNGAVTNVSVTFTSPILGVIINTNGLIGTDSSLGWPETRYSHDGARGMELGAEIVELSDDMLTFKPNRFSVTGCMEDARILTAPGGAGNSSYGMNGRAHRFIDDGNKILLVEYNKIVADVVGANASDVWNDQIAPRHAGMVNLLYVDGHVGEMAPAVIDPRVISIHNGFWCPMLDHPR